MSYRVLAINPGSTSTKIAVYEDSKEIFKKNVEHSKQDIEQFAKIADQQEMRYEQIMKVLAEEKCDVKTLSAVVGRGGLLPPLQSGAYLVNEAMLDTLKFRPVNQHASNLGAMIAYHIAQPLKIPAYIYDSVTVDEFEDIARISGMADIERPSLGHMLNMKATAVKVAKESGKKLSDMNMIVVHLGGGQTVGMFSKGKQIDMVSDDEGSFSPERSGRVPAKYLISLCYKYDKPTMDKKNRGKGGLMGYLGTNDVREVEKMINGGDSRAKLILEAQAYQIAKDIGEMATVVSGKVDKVVLTGGVANSKMLTEWIRPRVEWIAPMQVVPGENELESLALGTLRVLTGEERAHVYEEKVAAVTT